MNGPKLNLLKRNLRQVLSEAKKSGLGPKDIHRCVKSIAGDKSSKIDTKPCGVPSRRNRILMCILLLSISLIVVVLLYMYCLPVRVFLKSHAQYALYVINRRIRLISLPFIDQNRVSGYYESDCLVSNPFVHDVYIACEACSYVPEIESYRNIQLFDETYLHGGVPIKVIDSDIANINFDDIKDRFQKYHFGDNKTVGEVISHNEQWSSITEIFANEVTGRELILKGINVQWHVNDLQNHNFIRNIASVPYFFPMDEVASIERYTFIDSPSSGHVYDLPTLEYRNIWLSQVLGMRKIVLHPVDVCAGQCQAVETTLSKGETLYFNALFWKASSHSLKGDDLSIAICGSVL